MRYITDISSILLMGLLTAPAALAESADNITGKTVLKQTPGKDGTRHAKPAPVIVHEFQNTVAGRNAAAAITSNISLP